MNYWPLLFFGSVALLFLVPLAPALAEWHLKRDALPLQVVRGHDGNIRHFALSFRQFLERQFGGQPGGMAAPGLPRAGRLASGDAYQLVGQPGGPPSEVGNVGSTLLLGAGPLQLADDLFFEKEVYAAAGLAGGARNSFRAILADADIRLGSHCTVLRWAHSACSISLGSHARIYGRLSADAGIQLQHETRFGRMNAPVIRFGTAPAQPAPAVPALAPLALPDDVLDVTPQRWLMRNSFTVPAASRHAGSLVTLADLLVGHGSEIAGSIKSGGDLRLEGNARIDGAVVCGGDMHIGPDCLIKGPVVCEGTVTIETGSVIGSAAAQTTVTAEQIRVQEGVLAHGTVWARELGYLGPAPQDNGERA
jgi:cytoskeletal protein CcmA (bactofilin family)